LAPMRSLSAPRRCRAANGAAVGIRILKSSDCRWYGENQISSPYSKAWGQLSVHLAFVQYFRPSLPCIRVEQTFCMDLSFLIVLS
jgi:hypothetical protein